MKIIGWSLNFCECVLCMERLSRNPRDLLVGFLSGEEEVDR